MPFEKGKSGNPSGRPKEDNEIKELAKEWTRESISRLAYWMKSHNPKASVAAAMALLDRAYGKPQQSIDLDMTKREIHVHIGLNETDKPVANGIDKPKPAPETITSVH